MAHPYKKDADAGHSRKLKAYGGQSGNAPLTHAGFPALNTDTQAGRAPLNSKDYIPPEVTPRKAFKKGGKVSGAESLKRLDKASRKSSKGSKIPTGVRQDKIPSGTTEQVEFDPTLKFEPGAMSESAPRKKGGRVAKAFGGGLDELLANIGNEIFGGEEAAAAAPSRAAPRHAAARHAAPAHRQAPVVRRRITEIEHPADVPLPPRRPAMEASAAGAPHDTTSGRPDEGGMRSLMDRELYGAPTSTASSSPAPTGAAAGMPDEGGMRSFLSNAMRPEEVQLSTPALTQMYRKKGGRVQKGQQDYESRSHESTGAQKRASGGKAMHDDEAEDRKLIKKMVKSEGLTGKCSGGSMGRTKRADGGGAFSDYMGNEGSSAPKSGKSKKGGTVVNIMVGQPGGQQQPGIDPMMLAAMAGAGAGGPPGAAPPPPPPPGAGGPGGGMPPQMMMPPPPPPQGPPPGAGPMPRKDGGKVQVPYKKPGRKGDYPAMDFGSGGGFGRKQKIDSYGTKGPKGDSV